LPLRENTSFKGHHPKGYIKTIKEEEQDTERHKRYTRNTHRNSL